MKFSIQLQLSFQVIRMEDMSMHKNISCETTCVTWVYIRR